jgi:subtilisin-like proprotein convertase family protein
LNKLALLLAAGLAAAAQAQTTYTYSGSAVAIPDSPDGNCGPIGYAEVNVPDSFTVGSVEVGLNVTHPFQGDLVLTLRHVPSGRSVKLVDRPGNPESLIGFGATDYGSTGTPFRLSDSAGISYDLPQVGEPGIHGVAGLWKPQGSLAAFNGANASGAWRLEASDCAGMDTGMIIGFSLTLGGGGVSSCYANCDGSAQVPLLNVSDLTCFLSRFSAGCASPQGCYANCDGSTQAPFLNVQDFNCYLLKFSAGCTAP